MERKVDAVEAYQRGFKDGQQVFIELINKYCKFDAENIQQIIQAFNAKEVANDLYK